jgi:O-antigen ligase
LVIVGIFILINFFYSREYRDEVVDKATNYIKHPLVISVLAFIFISIISTIFAVDKYVAFWGEISRAEGLVGLMFFFAFSVFSLLTFEKNDWIWFFKLSLFTTLILLGKEFVEFFSGIARPGSFTGNPTFLAGYLLFSVTSALVLISEVKNIFWKYFSVFTIFFSILGIFIAQTRGTILGLGLGIIVALIYSVIKGKGINYKIFNLRKVSVTLLCLGIIFSGIFIVTRKNEVWQKVPGLSRLAVTSVVNTEDASTPVRLYLYKSSISSINPMQNSWGKLLIGWGPDNFTIAESLNYDPALYDIEPNWHDRAHNKFLDVLVMTGLLGLLAYIAIWIFLFRYILKKKEFSLTSVGLLAFATSYLTHLMFVFDQISTSIPFFMMLAFVVYHSASKSVLKPKKPQIGQENKEKREILVSVFLFALTVFLGFAYIKNTLPGYLQMRDYTAIIKTQNPSTIEKDIDGVTAPFTLAQVNIRRNFMEITDTLYNKKPNTDTERLLKKSVIVAEEYVKVRPLDFAFMTTLASFYNHKVVYLKNPEFLKRGEELFNLILSFSPNRPDINRGLAVNLYNQERYAESFVLFEKIFDSNLNYFDKDKKIVEITYGNFIKYFYEQKDKVNFIKVANRLKENNYSDSASLGKILDYLEKNGAWPRVNFE